MSGDKLYGTPGYFPDVDHTTLVLTWDEFTEPGDPEGPWEVHRNQVAQGHRDQELWGWKYTTTRPGPGKNWDPDKPPDGKGWVLNTYVGEDGHGSSRGLPEGTQVSYWRRREPWNKP